MRICIVIAGGIMGLFAGIAVIHNHIPSAILSAGLMITMAILTHAEIVERW